MTAAVTPRRPEPDGSPSRLHGRAGESTARSRVDVVIGRALGTVLVTVRGQLRTSTCDRFRTKVDKVLGEAPERVVIDLTEAVVDDDGVRTLCEVRTSAEHQQVQLVLTSRNPDSLAAIRSMPVWRT
jgi:anti-anti-sigma regulatory factor